MSNPLEKDVRDWIRGKERLDAPAAEAIQVMIRLLHRHGHITGSQLEHLEQMILRRLETA